MKTKGMAPFFSEYTHNFLESDLIYLSLIVEWARYSRQASHNVSLQGNQIPL